MNVQWKDMVTKDVASQKAHGEFEVCWDQHRPSLNTNYEFRTYGNQTTIHPYAGQSKDDVDYSKIINKFEKLMELSVLSSTIISDKFYTWKLLLNHKPMTPAMKDISEEWWNRIETKEQPAEPFVLQFAKPFDSGIDQDRSD